MGEIIVLDKSVREKIAAGEVVERPSSVVKELVENSLDAGANYIEINIEKGGHNLIEVIDNGCGILHEDVPLALERFATSKIKKWEEMENLKTFGFRGEALPSIASVSRFEMVTRHKSEDVGTKIYAEGGEILEKELIGTSVGTRIRVLDLFYNTPARKKFLKSPQAEASHIIGIVQKLTLVNSQVGFKLTSNGRVILNFPWAMDTKERIKRIWNLPVDYPVLPLEYEVGNVRITGFVCKPDMLKSHRSYQIIFVNGRYIKDRMINQAISEGFSPLLPAGKFPMALVFIDVPGGFVDYNVHPSKMEVKFVKPSLIFRAVRDAIKKEIRSFTYSPTPPPIRDDKISLYTSATPKEKVEEIPFQFEVPSSKLMPYKKKHTFKALAQIKRTYILGLWNEEVWIVDQHTAAERINYEKLMTARHRLFQSQNLLFPITLELSHTLYNFVMDKVKEFKRLGYIIEPFGGTSIIVKGIPIGMEKLNSKENLLEIFEDVASGYPYKNVENFLEKLISTTACRASVKAGDTLNTEEMESLVNELVSMDYSSFCPHGRPVLIKFSKEYLDKLFHRI